MSDFLELRRVMDTILKRWWFILVMVAVSATLGYALTKKQTPVYQATTTVLVGQSIELAQLDRVDIQTSEALVQTYVEMAQREPVLDGVVSTLQLNETWQDLRSRVDVQPVSGTQLIEIVVEAESSDIARKIADEVANQLLLLSPRSSSDGNGIDPVADFNREQLLNLQERILNGQKRLEELELAIGEATSEIQLAALQNEKTTLEGLIVDWERNYAGLLPYTTISGGGKEPNQLTVIEKAYSDNTQIRPNVKLNTLLGGVLGLVLALGMIFLFEFLDETYKSAEDLSQSEGLEVLGSVGKIKGKKYSDKVITRLAPFSPLAESYRIIRNRLHLEPDVVSKRSIMITSALPQEGKSLTVANLGIILAEANIKTVIVDADLRGSALHRAFDLESEHGLADVLGQPGARVEEYLKPTSVSNLYILTSGKAPSNASELLGSGSRGMLKIINDLKQFADIVILDSPPAAVFSDAMSLSNQVDDVILVVRAGKSKRSDLKKTLINLQNNRADFLGCIFNFSPAEDGSLSRSAQYFRPKWVPASTASTASTASNAPAIVMSAPEIRRDDFDYLAAPAVKNPRPSVLERVVQISEPATEGVVGKVVLDDGNSSSNTFETSEGASVENVPITETQTLEPPATPRDSLEVAVSETEGLETRNAKSQRHPKSFKKAVIESKATDESGEESSVD